MVTLILIRHGQSIWNLENRFTGWVDVPLSKQGIKEAKDAAKALKNVSIDIAFTSTLTRAQQTLFTILNTNNVPYMITSHSKKNYKHFTKRDEDNSYIDVIEHEALNERYYGDLQGLNKEETAQKFGDKKVHTWRRSFSTQPPNGESLKDTIERVMPYYEKKIVPQLKKGKNVIIAAHGNSLRALIKHLEKISQKEIPNLELKTGVPIIYELDDTLKIIEKK